jgi:hypothetical protein
LQHFCAALVKLSIEKIQSTTFLLFRCTGMASVVAVVANEQENSSRMDWFVCFGLTHGGDELAEVEVDYGGDNHDEDLRAGELITLAAGIVVYFPLPE